MTKMLRGSMLNSNISFMRKTQEGDAEGQNPQEMHTLMVFHKSLILFLTIFVPEVSSCSLTDFLFPLHPPKKPPKTTELAWF